MKIINVMKWITLLFIASTMLALTAFGVPFWFQIIYSIALLFFSGIIGGAGAAAHQRGETERT